jgi:DNA-binding SARP family transcriptional activator/tetratricopeptide (TPR) repeat protein
MRFRILGPLEVLSPDGWTAISASKWRSLLACLLVRSNQLVPTDLLIDELWGDHPPNTANNLVSIYFHRLRKVIGDTDGQVLVYRAPGYLLRLAPGDLDMQVFDAQVAAGRDAFAADDMQEAATLLGDALALWRGPLLADVPPSPLISVQADRAVESWLAATELRVGADLCCGRAAQVVAELRGLVAEHPLREGLWLLLMRSLEDAGRRAEALEVFAQAQETIAAELGVDPGVELQRFHRELLAADASAAASGPAWQPLRSGEASVAPRTSIRMDVAAAAATASGEAAVPVPGDSTADDAGSGEEPAADFPAGTVAVGTFADLSPVAAGPQAGSEPPPAVAKVRPAQLPADIGDFTGRETHVRHLCGLLLAGNGSSSPGAARIAVVNGAAGLGKTTLAVHAAHQVSAQFPDGQLYVDLLGASSQPASPGEVLARFLRDLGIEGDKVPARDDERAALYRTTLTGRRVLILLDNARDAAQIRPLLPGSSSCAVLATTRNRTSDLASMRFVDLNVLEDTEALALFTRIVGEDRAAAEPDATAEVLIACAGLPLAVRICAARLAARRQWRIATLAGRLRNQHRRLDELKTGDLAVRASFQVSYDSLRETSRGTDVSRVFRLLSVWQAPSISLPAAGALIGQPEDDVAEALETLVDVNLLESPAPDWYQFHSLLQVYAAERAEVAEPKAVREEAAARLLRWYLDTAEAAADAVAPQRYRLPREAAAPGVPPLAFADPGEALSWYQVERVNIVAATRQAASAGMHDVAWRLPTTLFAMFNRWVNWADCVTTSRIGLDSARAAGDRAAEAWVLNNLGFALARLRDWDAFGCLERALEIRRELGDTKGEAQTAIGLAEAHLNLDGPGDGALRHMRHAVDLLERTDATPMYAAALNNLGEVYQELGDLEAAEGCYIQARDISRETGGYAEGYTLHNLGEVYRHQRRLDDAIASYEQALGKHRAAMDLPGEALALKRLGETLAENGGTAEARAALTGALQIFGTIGDQEQAAQTTALLASLPPGGTPEAPAALARPDGHQDGAPGIGPEPASESPVREHQETPDHTQDSEAAAAIRAEDQPTVEVTAGAGPADHAAAGDRAGEDPDAGAILPVGEALLAALPVILMSQGITDREQAAAWSAKLIRSWPELPGLPGNSEEAGERPARVRVIPDAPGHDLRPDPLTAMTAADFMTTLRRLRQWAGNPSYRKMEEQCGRAAASATICTALTHDELPSQEIVEAIVVACGGGAEQVSRYITAWRNLEMKQEPRRQRGQKQAGEASPDP